MAKKFKESSTGLTDLTAALADRLADMHALAAAGRISSTIASGLYAVEICLKAKICQRLNLDQLLGAFEIHELDELLILTGLQKALNQPANLLVKRNWDEVCTISRKLNDLRYLPEGAPDLPDKARSPADVPIFLDRLENPNEGVIPWLLSQP